MAMGRLIPFVIYEDFLLCEMDLCVHSSAGLYTSTVPPFGVAIPVNNRLFAFLLLRFLRHSALLLPDLFAYYFYGTAPLFDSPEQFDLFFFPLHSLKVVLFVVLCLAKFTILRFFSLHSYVLWYRLLDTMAKQTKDRFFAHFWVVTFIVIVHCPDGVLFRWISLLFLVAIPANNRSFSLVWFH